MKLESNIYSNQNNNIVMRTMKYFLSLLLFNGSLKFEITAKRLYAASQRVL